MRDRTATFVPIANSPMRFAFASVRMYASMSPCMSLRSADTRTIRPPFSSSVTGVAVITP